jgi:hypothetical protein
VEEGQIRVAPNVDPQGLVGPQRQLQQGPRHVGEVGIPEIPGPVNALGLSGVVVAERVGNTAQPYMLVHPQHDAQHLGRLGQTYSITYE